MSTWIQHSILRKNFCNNTSSNSLSTLSQGKSSSFSNSQWEMKLSLDFKIVSWLGDFNVLGEEDLSGGVGGFVIELE